MINHDVNKPDGTLSRWLIHTAESYRFTEHELLRAWQKERKKEKKEKKKDRERERGKKKKKKEGTPFRHFYS